MALGKLGGLGGFIGYTPEGELAEGQYYQQDQNYLAMLQPDFAEDSALATQMYGVNPLITSPYDPMPQAQMLQPHQPDLSLQNMLTQPIMQQRPLDPRTIERVAHSLGLNPNDIGGEGGIQYDWALDPNGNDESSLFQLLGGPGYA